MFKNTIPTVVGIAKIAGVMPTTVRKNIIILLKMVLKEGYTLDKDFVERRNKRLIRDN